MDLDRSLIFLNLVMVIPMFKSFRGSRFCIRSQARIHSPIPGPGSGTPSPEPLQASYLSTYFFAIKYLKV